MNGSSIGILYVSDRQSWLPQLHIACTALGIDACIDAIDSQAAFEAELPGADLIVVDLESRGLTADRALALCAAELEAPPLVVLSEGASDEVAVECLRGGACDYVRLPNQTALTAAIGRALHAERDERLKAEARAAASRERGAREVSAALRQRQNVMDTLPDVVYTLDPLGRLCEWNGQLEKVTGLHGDQLVNRSAADFFAPEDQERVTDAVRQGFVTGYVEVEARMVTADGTLRPYQYTGVPLRDERGEIVGLTGVGRDITELQQAQRRTATLLEVARDISGTLDLGVLLERVQRKTSELIGCEIVATFYWDVERGMFRAIAHHGVPESIAPLVEAIEFPPVAPYSDKFASGESIVIRDAIEIRDLELPAGSLLAAPLRVQGRHVGALACFRFGENDFGPGDVELCEGIAAQLAIAVDAADMVRVQREDAQVSSALARAGQELIAALDTPQLLQSLCQVTARELGCDSSHTLLHLPEDDVFVFVAGHGYDAAEWQVMSVVKTPPAWFSSKALGGNGDLRHVMIAELPHSPLRSLAESARIAEMLSAPLRSGDRLIGFQTACNRNGQMPGFTSVQRRIAAGIAQLGSMALEHAKTVEALERASRLKSDFVATISHELRTPLNVILGYNELLLEGVYEPLGEKQREVLRRSDDCARELLQLIIATLDLSRIESGRMRVDVHEVALDQLLAEVESETRISWDNPAVALSWKIGKTLPMLHTDPLKVKVIVRNLLGNALKFTERGNVEVRAGAHRDHIEIAIADTGVGIAPEMQDYIFEAFRQGDGSATRRYGGVGLGLYTVRRLLDLLGGDVAVESQLGGGSTFRVRLPYESQPQSLVA